jgi:hypothetical protein
MFNARHASIMTSSTCNTRSLTLAITATALLLTLIAGCAKKEPAADAPAAERMAQTTRAAPPPEVAMPATDPADGSVMTANIDAAGIPVKYTARFDGDKLTHIDEVRDGDGRQGAYDFYGARLVKYSGAAVGSAAILLIEFDMQGAVASAQADPSPLANSEINTIRERAQLLRSHALAQHDTRMHKM